MLSTLSQHIGAVESTAEGSPNLTSYLFDKELNLIIAVGALVTKLGKEQFKPGNYILDAIPLEFGRAFLDNCHLALKGKNGTQERHVGDDYFVESFIPMALDNGSYNVMIVARNLSDLQLFKSMKESKEQLEEVLSAVNDVFFKTDLAGKILFVSPSCEKMLGYSQDTLTGSKISDLYVNPDERTLFLEELHKNKSTEGFIIKMKHANSDIITTSVSSNIKKNQKGEPYLYCTITDITEQVNAREKLNERTQLFKNLYSYSGTPIVFAYADGKLSMANEKFCDFLGYSEEELQSLNYQDFSHVDDLEIERRYHAEMLENKRDFYELEKRYLTKSGEIKWAKATISCIRKGNTSIDYIMGVMTDINESKKATLELKTSEKKFKNIFHNNGLAIYIVNTDGKIVMCNEGMQQLLGYREDELLGENVTKITYPEDIQKVVDNMANLYSGMESITLKKRYISKDDKVIIGEMTMSLFNSPDTDETQVIGVIKDITEHNKAEEALKNSEEKFRKAFENNGLAVAITNNSGNYLMCNKGMEEFVGYPEEELKLQTTASLSLKEDLPIVAKEIRKLTQGNASSITVRKRYITKDGKIKWGDLTVSLLSDEHTPLTDLLYLGVVKDITEQIQVEEALKSSEEKFRKIFENNAIGIATANLDGYYTLCNEGFCKILGYTKEELYKLKSTDITHPEDLDTTTQFIDDIFSGKISGYQSIKRYITKSGKVIWGEISVSAFTNSENGEVTLVGVLDDITEKKNAEEQLKITNKELQILSDDLLEQNSQLENFAHITSHNLRGPLSNLIMVNDVYHKTDSAEVKKQLAEKFGEEAKRMLKTLDVLAEQLHTRKKASVVKELLDFKKVYTETIDSLSELIETSNAKIEADFTTCRSIFYPKTYLDSIFLNLISNAIKYRSSKRRPEIKIKTYKQGESKYLEITDNGIGINLERNKSKLFGLYKTFHNHPDARGVGLFLIKNQVESLGGNIDVKSEPEKGTTFTILF